MGDDRFESLSEAQRHCLRLVAQGFSSKEIARPLGLHYRTIDARLDRARKRLGEADRAAAARALARHEAGAATYDAIIYDERFVAGGAETDEKRTSPTDRVEDVAEPFQYAQPPRPDWLSALNPFAGKEPDDLRPLERLTFILRLSVFVPMALGALSVGLTLLLKLLWSAGF